MFQELGENLSPWFGGVFHRKLLAWDIHPAHEEGPLTYRIRLETAMGC